MKKFFIIVMAAALCIAFTAPAMAKVTVGGQIQTDFYYLSQSDERINPKVNTAGVVSSDNGNDETTINMPQASNRLIVKYKNDDNTLNGYMQIRGGDIRATHGGNTLDFKYAWLDYKINDMMHFRAGRQPQAFAVYTPGAASMGFTDNFTLLVNYGNVQVTDGDSVKLYIKFNDNVRLEFQVEDPGVDNGEATSATLNTAAATPAGAAAATAIQEENTIPRFDIALPITIANFKFEPAFSWLRQEYDQVASGFEDEVDIWGFSLGARAGFGPLTISGEFVYGENIGDDTHTGGGATDLSVIGARARLVDNDGNGTLESIEDSTFIAGWIQLAFNFGPATLQVAVGVEDIENDGSSAPAIGSADDVDTTRWGLAFSLPIRAAKGFTVTPAVIYHDSDDSARDGTVRAGNPTVDQGDEILVGVSFKLVF